MVSQSQFKINYGHIHIFLKEITLRVDLSLIITINRYHLFS